MKTLAEAYDEFLGLANEAETWLEDVSSLGAAGHEMGVLRASVLYQLVELCAEALNTSNEYGQRMEVARRVLENGISEGLKDQSGTESPSTPVRPS